MNPEKPCTLQKLLKLAKRAGCNYLKPTVKVMNSIIAVCLHINQILNIHSTEPKLLSYRKLCHMIVFGLHIFLQIMQGLMVNVTDFGIVLPQL